MKLYLWSLLLFIIGIAFLITICVKYSKEKKNTDNKDMSIKSYLPMFVIMILCFVIAQVFLVINTK